jgi:hypothetical protein
MNFNLKSQLIKNNLKVYKVIVDLPTLQHRDCYQWKFGHGSIEAEKREKYYEGIYLYKFVSCD